jgi:hypothetical protein
LQPVASVPPIAAARSRVAGLGRGWQVLLFLGGFLVLAFILSAQAHADAPGSRPVPTAPDQSPTLVVSLERGAEQSVRAGKAQADRSVQDTVAAATESGDDGPTTGLLDAVQGVTHQVTTPLGEVIGGTPAGHGGSGHRTPGRPGAARRTTGRSHDETRSTEPAARATGHSGAPNVGGSAAGRSGHAVAPSRAPGNGPATAGHTEHPVESDGSAHHTGGAYPAVCAVGTRVHQHAVARPAACASAPQRRASDVCVDPD